MLNAVVIQMEDKQCDEMGDFYKFLATNFLTKVPQTFW